LEDLQGFFSRFAASSTHSWSGLTLQTNVLRNIDDFEAHRKKKILVATIFCLRQPATFVGRDFATTHPKTYRVPL